MPTPSPKKQREYDERDAAAANAAERNNPIGGWLPGQAPPTKPKGRR